MNNRCPSCAVAYKLSAKHLGRRITCSKCGTVLVVTEQGLECTPGKPAHPPVPAPSPPQAVYWQSGMGPPKPLPLSAYSPPQSSRPTSRSEFEALDDNDDDVEEVPSKPRWLHGFGTGCSLVKWGLWLNFSGFAYVILLGAMTLVGIQTKSRDLILIDKSGLFLPLFLFEITGSAFMAVGWWRMTGSPPQSGAVGLMTGAFLLAILRCLILFIGLIFMIMLISAQGLKTFTYLMSALSASYLAEACLAVATFSVIPGMAILGGEVPSRGLRQQAGWITLFHQVLGILLLSLFAAALYFAWINEFTDGFNMNRHVREVQVEPVPRRVEAHRPVEQERPSNPIPVALLLLITMLIIHGAYTYLHASLYSAGQRAALRPDRK
jgi:ribosomal protein S27AE